MKYRFIIDISTDTLLMKGKLSQKFEKGTIRYGTLPQIIYQSH